MQISAQWIPVVSLLASASASAASGYDPANACQQMCSCTCPGGLVLPAVPNSSLKTPPAPPAEPAKNPHGGATGYHSTGGFYGRRGGEAPEGPAGYPTAMVERPVILPEGVTQPEIAVSFFNDSNNSGAPVRERVLLGFQGTPFSAIQLGTHVDIAVNPRVKLDSARVSAQYGAHELLNIRADLGWRNSACASGAGAFSGGLGLPFKYRTGPHLAILSGRPLIQAFNDDLVTIDGKSCGTQGTIGLPVGVLATLGESYNFAVRTGYRKLWGNGASGSLIPLAFDFSLVVANQADVGLSFELPNAIGTPSAADRALPYVYEQRLVVFAQTRL